uniref:KleB protein n=2 Tax=root TaxID=1 RepID=F2Q6B8_9BACT|nr:KleB [Plasmid pMCBF1]ABO36609.1 KleB protein [uncultured bacterium pMCBF6]
MMSKGKIEIVKTACQRCGAPISMLSRSLFGADDLHVELGGICSACLTPEEDRRILEGTMQAALAAIAEAVAE